MEMQLLGFERPGRGIVEFNVAGVHCSQLADCHLCRETNCMFLWLRGIKRPGQVPPWSVFEEGRDGPLLSYLFSEQKLCPFSCLLFTSGQRKHLCSPLCCRVLGNL